MKFCLAIIFALMPVLSMHSCTDRVNEIDEFPEVTEYLGENCYNVIYKDEEIGIQIKNSSIIADQRNIGSPTFSYQQYASICALLISRYELKGINTLKVKIIDGEQEGNFHYKISDIRSIDKKVKVDFDFSVALKENDFNTAKQYFSDSLKQLSDKEVGSGIFQKNFPFGSVIDDKLIAFTIVGNTVGIFIEYEFDTKLRQTYIFIHEIGRSDSINDIKILTMPQL